MLVHLNYKLTLYCYVMAFLALPGLLEIDFEVGLNELRRILVRRTYSTGPGVEILDQFKGALELLIVYTETAPQLGKVFSFKGRPLITHNPQGQVTNLVIAIHHLQLNLQAVPQVHRGHTDRLKSLDQLPDML